MKRLPVYFIFLVLLAAGCSKKTQDGTSENQVKPGMYDSDILIDGIKRTFRYYIPTSYNSGLQPRLTFVLHGMTQTGPDIMGSVFDLIGPEADTLNSIIITPTALYGHWNDRMGGVFPSTDTIDDVKFLTTLIGYFVARFNVDPDGIYFMGFSNGGMMTYRMACEIPDRINAIAPFISMMGTAAADLTRDSAPVPVFITNGTVDPIMKWDGGIVGTSTVPVLGVLLSNVDNVAYWVNRNHADQVPDTIYIPDYCRGDSCTVVSYQYSGENEVIFNKVINGGHFTPKLSAIPVVPTYNCDYESVVEAWNFLHRHIPASP